MKGGGLCRTPASGPNTYLPTANHHTYKNKQKAGGPRALGRRRVPARHHRVRPLPDGQGWLGRQPRRVRVRQPARPGGGLRVYGYGRGLRVVPRAFCVRVGVCVCDATQTQQPITRNLKTQPPASAPLPPSFLRTAILHVGADALLRECYCPAKFPHRVGVFECVCFG